MTQPRRRPLSKSAAVGRLNATELRMDRLGARITPMRNGCWAFDGDLANYHTCGPSQRPAHRVIYVLLGHVIKDGEVLHHECENPGCVNPVHLTPMTPSEHSKLHAEVRAGRRTSRRVEPPPPR